MAAQQNTTPPGRTSNKLSSSNMSSADFRSMLQNLADEAEHRLPGPPPQVQKLHTRQKKSRRKMGVILLVGIILLSGLVFYSVKYTEDLPLGLGGIFKAYTVGTKAPVPEPGQPLRPSQYPQGPPR